MQCTYLPGKITESIDRVNRNFLLGSLEFARKAHWVSGEKVSKTKEEGGLGIQFAKGRNLALLAKLNWRYQTEGKSPWA